jgi:8-oxo-dGTP pyrophosphatase MutT (NUDIX family)
MGHYRHLTASVFVFSKQQGQWRIALIKHKKLKKWMIPGGHVESFENPEETARREVREELGIDIKLFSFKDKDSFTGNYSDARVIRLPELMVEELIPKSGSEPEHIHIDCLYLGISDQLNFASLEFDDNSLKWCSQEELGSLDMFSLTRELSLNYLEKLKLLY